MPRTDPKKTAFVKRERDALRHFMDKHVMDDFLAPPGSVGYSREYRCGCGFKCRDAGGIYDHTQVCSDSTEE